MRQTGRSGRFLRGQMKTEGGLDSEQEEGKGKETESYGEADRLLHYGENNAKQQRTEAEA